MSLRVINSVNNLVVVGDGSSTSIVIDVRSLTFPGFGQGVIPVTIENITVTGNQSGDLTATGSLSGHSLTVTFNSAPDTHGVNLTLTFGFGGL